jgi:rhodanese-related sulfurtransferase
MHYASAEAIKPLLTDGGEIAFLDLREAGQYGEGHPFFAVNLPYSRLEALAPALMPRRTIRAILFDNGDGRVAEKAAARLAALGYTGLTIMRGGAPAWAAAGFTLFKGVNLPSKTFGELVEHAMDTPSISANELKAAQDAGDDIILLDGRTPGEFRKMTLPGARSCPNAELGYRIAALGLGPATRVVVNCAGRTRSIIGAQGLRNLRVPHDVVALRNGTQGWALAGFELAHQRDPDPLPGLSAAQFEASRQTARGLIASAGLATISADALARQRTDTSRTHYLFDVRSAGEYAAAHLPGAIHAPGGQLVQATDQWVAVRNARIVLCDDTGLRAATTALWLRGMGHEVAILDQDAAQYGEAAAPQTVPPSARPQIAPCEVPARLAAGGVLLDLSPSMAYRAAHIAGARWVIRPRLGEVDHGGVNLGGVDLVGASEILLAVRDGAVGVSDDGAARSTTGAMIAGSAAIDLLEISGLPVSIISGGPEAWRSAGLDVIASPDSPPDADCIDYLFFVHDRHGGNMAAAQAYLDWETGLVAQLDPQERAVLRPELSRPDTQP